MNSLQSRGAFIVFEGCDKCGKTTQSKNLVEYLNNKGLPAKWINFPNRETRTGQIIDSYLRNKENLTDEGIHLLFAVNRWEAKNEMEKLLKSGTTLIADRYSFSGVAFSAAKGLDYNWCKNPEIGLLKPDLVVYMTATADTLSNRDNYGSERYENTEFQNKVRSMFEKLYQEEKNYWIEVDATKPLEENKTFLQEKTMSIIESIKNLDIQFLWRK